MSGTNFPAIAEEPFPTVHPRQLLLRCSTSYIPVVVYIKKGAGNGFLHPLRPTCQTKLFGDHFYPSILSTAFASVVRSNRIAGAFTYRTHSRSGNTARA